MTPADLERGRLIAAIRRHLDLSQEGLAFLLQVRERSIRNYEEGRRMTWSVKRRFNALLSGETLQANRDRLIRAGVDIAKLEQLVA